MYMENDSIKFPPIVFSSWKHWTKRSEIPKSNLPGVYLLARFAKPPGEKEANPLSKEIVVIGQTRRTLRDRWRDFDKAAFGRGGNHSEGDRYREKNYPNPLEELYVAAMYSSPLQWEDWSKTSDEKLAKIIEKSVNEARKLKRYIESSAPARLKGVYNNALLMYVERLLIMQFVFRWHKLPDCNAE